MRTISVHSLNNLLTIRDTQLRAANQRANSTFYRYQVIMKLDLASVQYV